MNKCIHREEDNIRVVRFHWGGVVKLVVKDKMQTRDLRCFANDVTNRIVEANM